MDTQHIETLYEMAAGIIGTRSTAEWLATFQALEIPASRINSLEDLPHDEHLRATAFFATLDDAKLGRLRFPGVPVKFGRERPPVRMPPRLGEHTSEVLRETRTPAPPRSNPKA